MALSQFNITVQDGNLGLVSTAGSENVLKFDVCTKGVPGQFYTFSSLSNVSQNLGLGSGADNVGQHLVTAGGPVSFVPLEPSQPGSIGSVTHVGSGAGAIAVSSAPQAQIRLTIKTAGVNGAAKFLYQVGTDGYSNPVTVPGVADGYSFRVPGTYTVATFGNGSYAANEFYLIDTFGDVTHTGTSPAVTQDSSPIDDYKVTLTVTKSGAAGTARFTYNMDGYNTSPPLLLSTDYAIPNTGVVISASSTFVAGDTYTFQTCGPTFSDSDLIAAAQALNLQVPFSMVHINNKHATATEAASFAADVEEVTAYLFEQAMYVRAMLNCPTSGTVATAAGSLVVNDESIEDAEDAFLNIVDPRIGVGAYDCILPGPISGLKLRRNWSWPTMTRMGAISPATDAAWVQLGGCPTVVAISNDERLNEGLSDAGFTVPCTIVKNPGFFVNQALTMAAKTNSDYSYWTNARVIDLACNTIRQADIGLLNSQVAVSKAGTILESSAKVIDARGNAALAAALVTAVPQQAVAATSQVDRGHVMTDGKLNIAVSVTPYFYARSISVIIGFTI